jgi:hypothetical protein
MFTFIETKLFTRLSQEYLSEDEYRELQSVLMDTPDIGDVIPNSGGVRKLRWRAAGHGKRGVIASSTFDALTNSRFGSFPYIRRMS